MYFSSKLVEKWLRDANLILAIKTLKQFLMRIDTGLVFVCVCYKTEDGMHHCIIK